MLQLKILKLLNILVAVEGREVKFLFLFCSSELEDTDLDDVVTLGDFARRKLGRVGDIWL